MGERVNANPATGVCHIDVPLLLPEGRAQLGNNLTLSYSSGAGNGSFGLGWSLSLPHISRRADKGVPLYGAPASSDIFQLSGEDDLIPWMDAQADGSWLIKKERFKKWTIRRYRPRNERFSSRIEHWCDDASGQDPGHWRVTTDENVTYLYGFDELARIADPKDPSRVFTWLLQEVRDDSGNAALYRYKAEDGAGVDRAAMHEKQRWIDGKYSATAQRYLKRVLYANLTPTSLKSSSRFEPQPWAVATPHENQWCYEVVLDYGEHDDIAPSVDESPGKTWAARKDGWSSYRSGFEVRTLRQCQRILVFHRIPGPATNARQAAARASMVCVREHKLIYQQNDDQMQAGLSFLERVEALGIGRDAMGKVYREPGSALPPVRFSYSQAQTPTLRFGAGESGPLPRGADPAWARWIDLNGEGLPGLLWAGATTWYYRANLSKGASAGPRTNLPTAARDAEIELAPPTALRDLPRVALAEPASHLLADVDADGRLDLVSTGERDAGYWPREGLIDRWDFFRHFRQVPSGVRSDRQARWIDLTGDGLPDILKTHGSELLWLQSLGEQGYKAPVQRLEVPHEPAGGPPVVFEDGSNTLFIADMSGDGLLDLVRIRSGSVVYWPSLGYGRFGNPISMGDCPLLDTPDQFDPKRIRLADIDGSGTTDLLYLHADRIDVYANAAGNRWIRKPSLRLLPQWGPDASVEVADIFGNGTSCLVWSGRSASGQSESLHVLDLTGGVKPHLLVSMDNGFGGQTDIDYSTSAREYLQDKLSGRPWHTRVATPVQVVSRITHVDRHAATRRTTRYRYHHGHYDGREREFRGFAFVEEWNAEGHGIDGTSDVHDEQPTRLIKRWFHTGAWPNADLTQLLAADYWADDAQNNKLSLDSLRLRLIDTPTLIGIDPADQLDAIRVLTGRPLREEVYGLDGSLKQRVPYVIREFSYGLQVLQARRDKQPAAVQLLDDQQLECVIERASISPLSERKNPPPAQQPRIQHTFALERDALGFVTRRAVVTYGRLNPDHKLKFQETTWVTLEDRQFHHFPDLPDAYRLGTLIGEQRHAVWTPRPWSGALWSVDELRQSLTRTKRVPPGTLPSGGAVGQIELIDARYFEYWSDENGVLVPAPLGKASTHALLRRELRLAFTDAMLASALGRQRLAGVDLAKEGGYVASQPMGIQNLAHDVPADAWWAPSPVVSYDRSRFLVVQEQLDPFGASTRFEFDAHALHLAKVVDAYANATLVETDYHALAPRHITDANFNRTAFRFDANARLVAFALLGKEGSSDGDSEDSPTAEFSYALRTPGQPMQIRGREREQHRVADTRWRDTITYTDGSGREILRKMRVEPGPVPTRDGQGQVLRDAQGKPLETYSSERWVGSGRVVYNEKGNPIRQYEPYFSDNNSFENDVAIRQWGVSPTMRYDALDRLVRTELPDGSLQKVAYLAWCQELWDEGDLVQESSWKPASFNAEPRATDASSLERCVTLSQRYAGTPTFQWLDALGRVCRISENDGANDLRVAHHTLDAQGRIVAVQDADDRFLRTTRFDLLGRALHETAAAAGETRLFYACDGVVLRRWTARGHSLRHGHDRLRRQTHLYVLDPASEPPDATGPPPASASGAEPPDEAAGFFDFLSFLSSSNEVDDDGPAPRRQAERLVHRVFYGESVADPQFARRLNLMGKVWREFDGAGMLTLHYDFKGNRTESVRRLRRAYRWQPDWSALAPPELVADSAPNEVRPELEDEVYSVTQDFDALDRIVLERHPNGTQVRLRYGDGGLLDAVDARPGGKALWQSVILNIDYNARGQRLSVAWGNGVHTRYAYDARRFRLQELKSWRKQGGEGQPLQHHRYFHDVAGNIVEITDESSPDHFFKGYVAPGGQRFAYDALYQVVRSEGRELPMLPPDGTERLGSHLPHRADLQALAAYTEDFSYDREGNLTRLRHEWKGTRPATWVREHAHEPGSNRLTRSVVSGSAAVTYAYDAAGNMLAMPHLPAMRWDAEGRLASVDRAAGARVWMSYDAQGQRVRKVHRHGERVEERIYLGNYEIYRRRRAGSSTVRVERHTSHLMDGTQRVAMVETLSRDAGDTVTDPVSRWRYQLNDHLGSAHIELDDAAKLISFEEFHAFGTTAVAAQGLGEVSARRYRYTGKERDEETGLCYHGARYLAPWLSRWISSDPDEEIDGNNRYVYAGNAPTRYADVTGRSRSINEWVNYTLPIQSIAPLDICTPNNPSGNPPDSAPILTQGRSTSSIPDPTDASLLFMQSSLGLAHLAYSVASKFTEDPTKLMYLTGAAQFVESLVTLGVASYGRSGTGQTSSFSMLSGRSSITQVDNVNAATRQMVYERSQLAKKMNKHGEVVGLPNAKQNSENIAMFKQKLLEHANDPNNLVFPGTYRRKPVTHIFNPKTGVNLMRDMNGEFLSIYKVNLHNKSGSTKDSQYINLLKRRNL